MGTRLVEEITQEVVAALTPTIRRLVAAAVAEQAGAPHEEKEEGSNRGAGPGPLLTARQVSAMLQLPPARIYALAREGKLPRVKVGKRQVRFESEALREWVRQGAAVPPRSRRAPEGRDGADLAPSLFDGEAACQRRARQ